MERRRLLKHAGAVMGGTALLSACRTTASLGHDNLAGARPNIVFILFDDTGYSDFGCYGSEIATPNIDALASAGLRYSAFETRAICSPTRAALLSGRNSHSMGMKDLTAGEGATGDSRNDGDGVLAADGQLLPDALRRAGYSTFMTGKWHLAPAWQDGTAGNNDRWPLQCGFDRFYGILGGWADQYRPDLVEGNRALGKPTDPDYHFSAAIVDKAIEQIDGRDPAKPFFLYLSFGATHSPIQVSARYIDKYAGAYDRGWDVVRAERFARQKAQGLIPADTRLPPEDPKHRPWASLGDAERRVFARFMAAYAGFLDHADEQIGRLIARLKAEGLFENTLFVVASDNGPSSEGGPTGSIDRLYPPKRVDPDQLADQMERIGQAQIAVQTPWTIASATPFRRYKVWPYLGGTRAPLIWSWSDRLPANAVRRQTVDDIDIAPTLAEIAGASFASSIDGIPQQPVAGASIALTLTAANAPDPRPVQYFELRGNRAIRQGRWRAVAVHRQGDEFSDDRWALFDLATDFNETTDLAARHPAKLAELRSLWMAEATKYGALPLTEGPEYMRRFNAYGDEFAPRP